MEPLYGGLVCKYENPPFAKSMANYRWFANGSPFTQVMHGDPSLPAGFGRGSLPESDRIMPREIPEDIPFDATFVCEVRFTNQKGALKRLLKLKKNNPPQVFKSEPAPLAGRAAPAP